MDMTHKIFKVVGAIAIAYLLTIATLLALITAVYCIPRSAIEHNVLKSYQTFAAEGQYKMTIPGLKLTQLDNYSDELMINEAWLGDAEQPYASAMKSPSYDHQDLTIDEYLMMVPDVPVDYVSKYWHGYLVVLKPMLVFFDYDKLRIINYVVFGLVLGLCLWLLYSRVSRFAAWSFGALCVVYLLFIVPLNFQFSNAFYLALLSVIATVLLRQRTAGIMGSAVMFYMMGGITSFVDFFTIPMLIMCMPVIVYMLIHNPRRPVLTLFRLMAFWVLGYGSIWASKWAICTLTTEVNAFECAFSSVAERMDDFSRFTIDDMPNMAIYVWIVYNRYVLLAFMAVMLMALYLYARRKQGFIKAYGWLIIIAAMPILYFVVVNNHFMIHNWFTWRSTFITAWAILLLQDEYRRMRKPA